MVECPATQQSEMSGPFQPQWESESMARGGRRDDTDAVHLGFDGPEGASDIRGRRRTSWRSRARPRKKRRRSLGEALPQPSAKLRVIAGRGTPELIGEVSWPRGKSSDDARGEAGELEAENGRFAYRCEACGPPLGVGAEGARPNRRLRRRHPMESLLASRYRRSSPRLAIAVNAVPGYTYPIGKIELSVRQTDERSGRERVLMRRCSRGTVETTTVVALSW